MSDEKSFQYAERMFPLFRAIVKCTNCKDIAALEDVIFEKSTVKDTWLHLHDDINALAPTIVIVVVVHQF